MKSGNTKIAFLFLWLLSFHVHLLVFFFNFDSLSKKNWSQQKYRCKISQFIFIMYFLYENVLGSKWLLEKDKIAISLSHVALIK